jgi:hypothetical protein
MLFQAIKSAIGADASISSDSALWPWPVYVSIEIYYVPVSITTCIPGSGLVTYPTGPLAIKLQRFNT